MKIDHSTPVILLNTTTHGSLGIMRSLGRWGVGVHALHTGQQRPTATYSRYCRSAQPWPFRSASDGEAADALLAFGNSLGERAILLPTCDETALFAAQQRERLAEHFFYPQMDAALVAQLCSKKTMAALAQQHDVPTPEVAFPVSHGDVEKFAGSAVFPVVVKAIDGARLMRRTGKNMVIVNSASELFAWYNKLDEPGFPNLMLQEYIPGGDDSVWMFNGYFDEQSNCRAAFTGKKIRQYPVYTGASSLAICLANDNVEETTKRFMKAIGYRGILDIGYRFDARDGKYKVLDINPRIGATFRLFLDRDGMDVARFLYLDLTAQTLPGAVPRHGRKWLVEFNDLVSCVKYHRDGKLTLREWLKSFRGVEEVAYFSWRDPRPFMRMAVEFIGMPFRRLFRGRTVPKVPTNLVEAKPIQATLREPKQLGLTSKN